MKKMLLLAVALVLGAAACAQGEYYSRRSSLFDVLPIHSNDIVFLGNSITDGCEWAELFDNRHVKNRGIVGDRTEWMLRRIDSILVGHPKKLFLMIGANDLAAGLSPELVVSNIRRIVERFREESPWTRIYIQSMLPVNGRDFDSFPQYYSHGEAIRTINRRLANLCADRKNLVYIDLHSAFVDDEGLLDKRYTNDGLHLTGEGYLVWRDVLEPYVK